MKNVVQIKFSIINIIENIEYLHKNHSASVI